MYSDRKQISGALVDEMGRYKKKGLQLGLRNLLDI